MINGVILKRFLILLVLFTVPFSLYGQSIYSFKNGPISFKAGVDLQFNDSESVSVPSVEIGFGSRVNLKYSRMEYELSDKSDFRIKRETVSTKLYFTKPEIRLPGLFFLAGFDNYDFPTITENNVTISSDGGGFSIGCGLSLKITESLYSSLTYQKSAAWIMSAHENQSNILPSFLLGIDKSDMIQIDIEWFFLKDIFFHPMLHSGFIKSSDGTPIGYLGLLFLL